MIAARHSFTSRALKFCQYYQIQVNFTIKKSKVSFSFRIRCYFMVLRVTKVFGSFQTLLPNSMRLFKQDVRSQIWSTVPLRRSSVEL